jgi:hypothetical protein
VNWTASDASGVCRTELEHSIDGGAFTAVALPHATARTIIREHSFGHRYQYRVRATDCAGNTSAWKTANSFTPAAQDAAAGAVSYASDWAQQPDTDSFQATLSSSSTPGASASYATSARRIAWIAPRGPGRGSARVSVDGIAVATLELSAASPRPRSVVWQTTWKTAGHHTIQIEALAGRVDIDAFAVLR